MTKTYLLLGPEQGEKAEHLKKLKAALLTQAGNELEQFKFYPYETDIETILSVIQNGSLFSNHKLVLIQNAHDLNSAQSKKLAVYCKEPSKDTTLVLLSDEMRIDNAVMKVIPKENTKIFWEMFENKKRDWLQGFFRKAGKNIEQGVIDLILDLVENNTLDLKRECTQLINYYAGEEYITVQLVEDFIFHSKVENIFTLFNRIAAAEYTETLDVFNKLLNSGEIQAGQLIPSLYWQFKRLSNYVLLCSQRYNHNEICTKLNIKGKKNQQMFQNASRNFNMKNIADMSSMFSDYDRILKESRGEMSRIQAELFLYYLTVKKGKPADLPLTLAGK